VKPGAAGEALVRARVVAVAAVLALALSWAGPAFADSIEASPVVTVPGSQVEGTVTIHGSVSLSTATIAAIAEAVAQSQVPTVSVVPSVDDVQFRSAVLVAGAVGVLVLGIVAGALILV
jgi:hypothetical protein